MAAFSESQLTTPDGRVAVDWHLMQNGAVTLFPDRCNFDFAATWLHDSNYLVHHIDCADHATFQQQFSDSLRFQQQFGYDWNGNLDALNDGFSEFDFANVTGVVLAFSQFDTLLDRDTTTAHAVLDIAEWNSRFHLLFAHRLITIAQCTKRDATIPKLGGNDSCWNTIRWANSGIAP
ncbi:MAG: barstar family protein, partial [bacterium]|nr:barstar family protein [bacterium]